MSEVEVDKQLSVEGTPIPGLLRISLELHEDNRGWFKENWQREKMLALGLPDMGPVQNNISFNCEAGVTRGIHAEPWDKFISVATGRVFGAWVDLREGPTFGTVYSCEIDPSVAVYVPSGVGNAYQTLEPNTAYTYLVNAHWSPEASYTFLNLADETVAIDWPVRLDQAIRSEKDLAHPMLDDVIPFVPAKDTARVLVTGANGQLGKELMKQLSESGFEATGVDLPELDISDAEKLAGVDWSSYDVVINAAAWTNVDGAETEDGRRSAWMANAVGPANLAKIASEKGLVLVHLSTEYIFDGTVNPHTEAEPPSPLGVYGQSKSGGDAAVLSVPRHYLVRTSWVVGDGKNFIRTMVGLAEKGIAPSVVSDQVGRLTFTTDLGAAIIHLLKTGADYGTYNVSNEGPETSWYQVAEQVFRLTGHDPSQVSPITTQEYFAGKQVAPRPLNSTLDLTKIKGTGFIPALAEKRLAEYLTL